MKIILFYFIIIFLNALVDAQENLIYNGDFEIYKNCPESYVRFGAGVYELIPGWFINNLSTPDYFNSCSKNSNVGVPQNFAGNIEAYSGDGYVGLILRVDSERYAYSRWDNEHLQAVLMQDLKRNDLYCFQFYYVLAKNSGIASNGLSVYFSNSKPNFEANAEQFYFTTQLEMPRDSLLTETNRWNLFSGIFRASGQEKYFIVGNFTNLNETKYKHIVLKPNEAIHSYAYYLFDNFKLFRIEKNEDCNCTAISNQLDSFPSVEFKKVGTSVFSKKIEIGETFVLKNIYFEFDKTDLLPSSFEELNKVLSILIKNQKMSILISGHTDNIGTENYNKALSEMRAKSVLEFFYKNGIEVYRMQYIGYGSKFLLYDNNLAEGRKQNRRVEVKILSL